MAEETTARVFAARAAMWVANHDEVRAAVVFGSVARGTDNEYSDLDLILVAEAGGRDELWARRAEIAGFVLDADVVSSQEPGWQGAYRYQAWTMAAGQLDLTVAEGDVTVFGGLARGFVMLIDRADVGERLAAAVAEWRPPVFDAAGTDPSTWAWFRYLAGRLRRGEYFAVRAGVMDTLMNRVVPMLGSQWHSASVELVPEELRRIQSAAPTSGEPAELSRSLRATAEVYDWALDQWSTRTGSERPRDPLAAVTMALLPSIDEVDPGVTRATHRRDCN